MKNGVNIQISKSELSNFSRKIDRAQNHIQNKVREEIQYAALETETEAKQRVPVDTSNLKTNIKSDFKNIRSFVARVFTNVEYAKFIELGTFRMPAQPYLHPAFQQAKRKLLYNLKKLFKGSRI